jgi:hypothetical protein
VEIQAAIDAAEAQTSRNVVTLLGEFTITSPIYIGYSGTTPIQNTGTNLIGIGATWIIWGGTTQTSPGVFMINYATTDIGGAGQRIEGLSLRCDEQVNGVYLADFHEGVIENMRIFQPLFIGVASIESWMARYDNVKVQQCRGIGMLLLRNNAGQCENAILHGCDLEEMPDVKSYRIDNWSESAFDSTFQPLETINDGGSKTAVFLGWADKPSPNMIVVAHTAGGDFADNDALVGAMSTHTADVHITDAGDKHDLRSCLYTSGVAPRFENTLFEKNAYTDDDNSLDYPMVLIHGEGTQFRQTYAERGNDASNHSAALARYARKMANVWFKAEESDQVVISGVQGGSGSSPLTDSNVTVTDNGATGTVTLMDATLTARMADDGTDKVFLWGAGITNGEYTVTSGTIAGHDGTEFDIDEDPEGTAAAMDCYCRTLSDQDSPDTLVQLVASKGPLVENIRAVGFTSSYVSIDSDCEQTVVGKVQDHWIDDHDGVNVTWVYEAKPAAMISNAGKQTWVLNHQWWDASGLTFAGYNDATWASGNGRNQEVGLDGPFVASATVMDITTAWGPAYKVYVTGDTQVDELDGGHVGQVVTLIGTDATGFLIDDDDARTATGAIDLIGADDDTTLEDYEAITLICIVDTAAAQIWVELGNW